MNREGSIRNLQIIAALDSLSYGLIYPFIASHILMLGGSHVTVGFLAVGNLLGELLSRDVLNTFTHLHGKRYSLFFVLNTALITHLMLVLTNSCWFTILVRILFSVTNQSQNLCRDLLLGKAQSEDEQEKIRSNYGVLSGSGYVLGPIVSGCLFDFGFVYVGLAAAGLALINTALLMKVMKDGNDVNPAHADQSALEKVSERIRSAVGDFRRSDCGRNWDLVLIRYLFACAVAIFFSKFSPLLKRNYGAGSATVGCTHSYANVLIFCATYCVAPAKRRAAGYAATSLCEAAFFALTAFSLLACCAPRYGLYAALLAPIAFLRAFVAATWKELFRARRNEPLCRLGAPCAVSAGATAPILFGIACDRIGQRHAVAIFSCAPMFVCWAVSRFYSRRLAVAEDDRDRPEPDKDK